MKRIFALAVIMGAVIAAPAFALSLDEAKAKGLVGERLDGYIGAVTSSADVNALVDSVNKQRKQAYADIASKNGQPVSVVEKLAAAKLVERTNGGQYYMDQGGNWKRK